jgi:hypothetical protein
MSRCLHLLLCGWIASIVCQAPVAVAHLTESMDEGLPGPILQIPQSLSLLEQLALDPLSASKLAPGLKDPASWPSDTSERKTANIAKPYHDGQATAPAELASEDSSTDLPLDDASPVPSAQVVHTDYQKAMSEAAQSRKLLFIYFYDPKMTAARKAFETLTLAQLEIREKLSRFVIVTLPTDARITMEGKSIVLLEHAAFAEMLSRPGVAMIDLSHERAEYYGHVVSTFPFTPGKYYRKEALSIVLDLPPGTLTQRTMIYAVRIHPESPASTQGQFHNVLASEARSHADYQAAIQVQGHHSWDSRFHRINSKLPGDVLAQEVVAESWPNESLVEACVDCVDSWRQSPGHWGAVRSRHPLFGYDIKRGRNGIWYATGIFGLGRR